MSPMGHSQEKREMILQCGISRDQAVVQMWDSSSSQAETVSQHRRQAKPYPGNRIGKIKQEHEHRMLFE